MSQFVTEISTELPREKVYFDELSMQLTPGGLEVRAKSPVFAEWAHTPVNCRTTPTGKLSRLTLTPEMLVGPVGMEMYLPSHAWAFSLPGYFAEVNQRELFQDGTRPNLSWLFCKDLAEGAKFIFKAPVSFNNWEDYFLRCTEALSDIYLSQIRSSKMSARMKEVLDE